MPAAAGLVPAGPVRQLTGWLFQHAGAEVIEGATDPANAAMRAVFQQSGWASSGPVTEFGRDWDVYRITRDGWRARSRGTAAPG